MRAKHYRELEVWQLCEEIRRRVIAETARSPAASDRKFCNQIRDAAEDAVADVAEGFVRFRPGEFAQFLGYALSSLSEVRERTRHAHARRFFSDTAAAQITVLCVRADRAARALRQYLWTVAPDQVPFHPNAVPRHRHRNRGSR
jgi:four helix bundle protein